MSAVAIVTGASSGIGQACARQLSATGVQVFGMSRTLSSETPSAVRHLSVDVTDDDAVRAGVASVLTATGRIDLLINSAGFGLAGAVADTSPDEARRQFEVNVFGALRLCQATLPAMQRQRSGLILNVTSLGGLFGLPFQGLYSASKFALEGLSEALRHEAKPFGIDVVTLAPGDVRTAITRNRVRAAASDGASAYRDRFEAAMAIIEQDEGQGVAPETVAEKVVAIWRAPKRRARYVCGHASQTLSAWAKRALPGALFESLIADHYAGRPAASETQARTPGPVPGSNPGRA
jgi:NAD(P)-dependent dehydrogenase (short-subunit alcohol dehydrogenase family)